MATSVNTNNIESKNGMSQVINILTGETKKIRCHYLSKRTDKPVSRVLTLERLSHPALTEAGVTAWAERFNDGVNRFDWIRVSIQLTDSLCYTPNCANHDLPSIEHYNDYDDVNRRNVDNFFQSIADKPAKMMTGEDWPNMAVIAAYKAAGRDQEADTLTAARDTYNARREAKNEAWSKKYAAQQYYYNSPKPKNFDDMTELERAQFMMQTAQECAKDHPELDWADILEKAEKRLEKAKAERQERYNARCKELEAEALAQMPYKVGDTVTSRYGDTGRVVEMYPEITGDTDSPHLIYEYDGKPTVNVVILDTDGKRHCAHWSVYTLEPASEIKAIDVLQVGTMVRMPGVIGGLRVEEIDRKGDRVICVDGCKERHTYKGLEYFTATAEEIRIPEWLRICQYFEMDESFGHTRVLCTDIEPCCDALWPVLIRWEDGEDKGGIHLTSALDALNRKAYYYSEYQKLGHQEQRPQEWLKKTTNEKRATYYRACVELERLAGDGLPLVIRADGADTEANPWNALEKRVKTARVFHLGDRVKVKDGSREVTGIVNGIRCNEGSLALGGWCTHYNIQWDKQYQYTTGYGTVTGCGNIGPERIELIERAEFCPEPAADWLQPGEKVAHYLDYGDGTGDWLTGNVTGYELCDDGTVIVIYGEYRTALAGMVKYQPGMDEKAA